MKHANAYCSRRAVLATVALGIMGFVILLGLMLARSAFGSIAEEHRCVAEAQAEQWLISAHARSRAGEAGEITLTIDRDAGIENMRLTATRVEQDGREVTRFAVEGAYRGRIIRRELALLSGE
ncbi:MAG: hypothetical protein ACKVS9_09420 [Phycisphaerae bacterium]